MAGRVFTIGSRLPAVPLLSDPASRVWPHQARDLSISEHFATLGRVANPAARMCAVASVFGRGNAPRNISGAPRGDAPADGAVGPGWHKVGLAKASRQHG